ncbi:MAG: hypothetical protein RRY23_08665 [Alistipes sp.]
MKLSAKIQLTLAVICLSAGVATAKNLTISINNVRNDKGSILLMGRIDGVKEPVYQMVPAKKGSVVIEIADLTCAAIDISIFHDENGNYQMEMGDRGPIEGYVTKKYKLEAESTSEHLKLFYPVAE